MVQNTDHQYSNKIQMLKPPDDIKCLLLNWVSRFSLHLIFVIIEMKFSQYFMASWVIIELKQKKKAISFFKVNEKHPEKAYDSIDLTEGGIMICSNKEHPEKANDFTLLRTK